MTTIFTIGHSTHSAEEFLALLRGAGVEQIVDVRQFPGSRRWPHFGKDSMSHWLPAAGIDYVHEVDLGGRRRPQEDSPNIYWENPSFRAYADYMQTPEFVAALSRLIELARDTPTAIMCSEAVPWRCHRSLISDALIVRGHEVRDILGGRDARARSLNPHARLLADYQIIYDRPSATGGRLF
jgi:uncharacterized protein (DUF488 family)